MTANRLPLFPFFHRLNRGEWFPRKRGVAMQRIQLRVDGVSLDFDGDDVWLGIHAPSGEGAGVKITNEAAHHLWQAIGAKVCDACGGNNDVQDRGWRDEGDVMLTCVRCGSPSIPTMQLGGNGVR